MAPHFDFHVHSARWERWDISPNVLFHAQLLASPLLALSFWSSASVFWTRLHPLYTNHEVRTVLPLSLPASCSPSLGTCGFRLDEATFAPLLYSVCWLLLLHPDASHRAATKQSPPFCPSGQCPAPVATDGVWGSASQKRGLQWLMSRRRSGCGQQAAKDQASSSGRWQMSSHGHRRSPAPETDDVRLSGWAAEPNPSAFTLRKERTPTAEGQPGQRVPRAACRRPASLRSRLGKGWAQPDFSAQSLGLASGVTGTPGVPGAARPLLEMQE